MIPQTKSSRFHFVLKQPLLLTVLLCCTGAAILLWRACEPVAGQTRVTIEVRSADFVNGSSIPRRYTCDGANLSPQLEWQTPPVGAKSFAFVMDDPDAPATSFTGLSTTSRPVRINCPKALRRMARFPRALKREPPASAIRNTAALALRPASPIITSSGYTRSTFGSICRPAQPGSSLKRR